MDVDFYQCTRCIRCGSTDIRCWTGHVTKADGRKVTAAWCPSCPPNCGLNGHAGPWHPLMGEELVAWCRWDKQSVDDEEPAATGTALGPPVNDATCPRCRETRCSSTEATCWRCGCPLR